jgi:hypothetical protein
MLQVRSHLVRVERACRLPTSRLSWSGAFYGLGASLERAALVRIRADATRK